MHETWFGPKVLVIDLVMHSKDVFWKVYGSNLMVKVEGEYGEGLWCLGFVDGGDEVRTSVVIGASPVLTSFNGSPLWLVVVADAPEQSSAPKKASVMRRMG
ncbi:basic 7S globulin [Artemisia annua]|uniref:Basic 7S globulin n=1 Tax=Artemisia annua TaxID=35608 RepID=A0A2U1K8Y3_ARTAN|nr:basic 7S globulin [Artemisia annua]PWA69386.1 basic 7S globulin [Artemisia annua]